LVWSFDLEALDRFENGGYRRILVFLFPASTGDVTVVAIITNHLLSLVGYVRANSG